MQTIRVLVTRRYSTHFSDIESIVSVAFPNCSINMVAVDARMRPSPHSDLSSVISLSIIIAAEIICDREEQHEWLERTTQRARSLSDRVCVLLFSQCPETYVASYNKICPHMKVICLRDTTDDAYNIDQIREKLKVMEPISQETIADAHLNEVTRPGYLFDPVTGEECNTVYNTYLTICPRDTVEYLISAIQFICIGLVGFPHTMGVVNRDDLSIVMLKLTDEQADCVRLKGIVLSTFTTYQ